MPNRFANGVRAIAMCDRCGQQYKLKKLKTEIIKQRKYQLLVCEECWDPDHPQLMLGTFPVEDPQALRNPRRDNTYITAGTNGLQDNLSGFAGYPTGGSRDIQWGWLPVGGSSYFDAVMTPNYLVASSYIGDVTVTLDSIPGPSLTGVSATGSVGNALGPLAITGVQATGAVGGVGNIDVFSTGVSASFSMGTPIQGVTVSKSIPGSQYEYYNSGQTGWSFRLLWNTAENQARVLELYNEVVNCTNNQIWLYANGQYGTTPTSSQPEQCFGRIIGASYQPNTGSLYFWLDGDMLPYPQPQTGWWYTYSYVRVQTRFYIPAPNNGDPYSPSPPFGGYNPLYANNGATCTLTWTGDAAATLYSTYQSSSSIVGSRATAKWGTSFYDNQGIITMGVVTNVSYSGGSFVITMNTVTPVASPTYWPMTITWFAPVNPSVAYISTGISATPAIGSVAQAITMSVSTPSQSVQFQSAPGSQGYEFDVSYANPSTPLGNWIGAYGGNSQSYNHSYMFADVGGTYVGLGYLPQWQLQPGQGNNLYWRGYVGNPLPSNWPGMGFWSFNNFIVAAQFYITVDVANSYASYSTAGGQATFTWTGNNALQMRDTYAKYPALPAGTEIRANLYLKDINTWLLNSNALLGTLLSMGYSSGTFTMTYTVVTSFTPLHDPVQVGDTYFQSGINFAPLVINV